MQSNCRTGEGAEADEVPGQEGHGNGQQCPQAASHTPLVQPPGLNFPHHYHSTPHILLMEALIGIVGQDFVLMAADRIAARSIVVMKGAEDKFRLLSPRMAMTYAGEPGDTVQFAEYIQRNIKLYAMRNEVELGTEAASHFIRRALADSLRTKVPCVNGTWH